MAEQTGPLMDQKGPIDEGLKRGILEQPHMGCPLTPLRRKTYVYSCSLRSEAYARRSPHEHITTTVPMHIAPSGTISGKRGTTEKEQIEGKDLVFFFYTDNLFCFFFFFGYLRQTFVTKKRVGKRTLLDAFGGGVHSGNTKLVVLRQIRE